MTVRWSRPGLCTSGSAAFTAPQRPCTSFSLNAGHAHDWAICGVGVMPADRAMQKTLTAQDYLYTLVLKHAGGDYESRVVGSIIDYLYAPDNAEGGGASPCG